MKWIQTLIILFLCVPQAFATHRARLNASNLTQGTVPNERLSADSVTLKGNFMDLRPSSATYQGNSIIISTVAGGLQTLYDRFQSFISTGAEDGQGGDGFTQKSFDLTMATVGVTGVDIASGNIDGWIDALARVGAGGLTESTSLQFTIGLKSGIYDFTGATNPYGIHMYCQPGSSTVLRWDGSQMPWFIRNHGKISNCLIDGANRPWNAYPFISMRSSSALDNVKIYGAGNFTRNTGTTLIRIQDVMNTRIYDLSVDSYAAQTDTTQGGLLEVIRSSDTFVHFKDVRNGDTRANADKHIYISHSARGMITGETFDPGGGIHVFFSETVTPSRTRDFKISGFKNWVFGSGGKTGSYIVFGQGSGGGAALSTGTEISDNHVLIRTTPATYAFSFPNNIAGGTGLNFVRNHITHFGSAATTILNIGSQFDNCNVSDNFVWGSGAVWLSDAGVSTDGTGNYTNGTVTSP